MTTPAYEHNGAPCTRQAFYAIACDPRRSVAVEACAGAGKTWMLVSRMLRALLAGSQAHEILAITFTKKAAGEMRQRLQQWLADFAAPRPAETEADWAERLQRELEMRGIEPRPASTLREPLSKLYNTLLAQGRPVQIRTFHSWFAALLRNAPLAVLQQLGLPSAYELLEDDADAVAQVWRGYLRRVAGDAALAADYAELVQAHGRSHAHHALEAALARRIEFQLADAAGHLEASVQPFGALYPELAGLADPAEALAGDAARVRWLARAKLLGTEQNKTPQRAAALVVDAFAQPEPGARLALLRKAFFVAGEDRLTTHLQKFAAAQEAEPELQRLLAAERQHAGWRYHQRLVRLTRPLIEEFARLKRERGWVDMTDVERAALTLLSDPVLSGWVQQRLDARVRHLLIDEFQDTNPLQWQALHAWLSGYAGAGGGAGEVPSVFIVGDPKQSIYRFRRADPRVFAAAQDFIVQALGGDRLACDHTHRNAPEVLAAVNTVMGQAQAAGQFSGFRAHTTEASVHGHIDALPLVPRPEPAPARAAHGELAWRDSLDTPRVEVEDSLRTLESRQAARWIAARVAAGVPPERLMVLSRKREPLGVLLAELRLLGIASEQPEKLALRDLPAVQDVLALVDALVSPGNDLALARALKSPLFRLPDADLARLALAARAQPGERRAWLDVLSTTALSAQDGSRLHADLMQYRQWLLSLPPHDALQAIYGHRDVLARHAAAAPPPEREHVRAQLRALLGAALQVQGGRFLTAYQWVRALRRQSLAAPRHAAPEAVQLLTVHGAKGLEADEVLLLDAAGGPPRGGGAAAFIDWPGDAAAPLRFAFVASENHPPPSLLPLAEQEAAAEAREELNALYVAMTRARLRLVLSGFVPHRPPTSSWWQRIEPLAEPLPAPQAPAEAAADEGPFQVLELPQASAQQAPAAIQKEAGESDAPASAASRIGETMHWLLEHAGDSPQVWLDHRIGQARRRFGADAAEAGRAEALARRILAGEAAWAWGADEVIEAFNEVEITHQGQRLRIDRLVRRRAGAAGPEAWWVLDYKSAFHPERDPDLLAQMARYRNAVARLHPGQRVGVAFLTGEGRVLTLPEQG